MTSGAVSAPRWKDPRVGGAGDGVVERLLQAQVTPAQSWIPAVAQTFLLVPRRVATCFLSKLQKWPAARAGFRISLGREGKSAGSGDFRPGLPFQLHVPVVSF